MSSNHLEFDEAIQELQAERPPHQVRKRSLAKVLRPPRRVVRLPGIAAIAAAVAAVVILLAPSRGSGRTLSDVVSRTEEAKLVHVVDVDRRGVVVGEQWWNGSMTAWVFWNKNGRLVTENRSDAENWYVYRFQENKTAPNDVQYGTLYHKTPQTLQFEDRFQGPAHLIADYLKDGRTRVLRHPQLNINGRRIDRYDLVERGNMSETVDADPATGQIISIHDPSGTVRKFDYPQTLDPKIFSYKSRLTRDVAVLDLRGKEDPKKLPPYMPAVIESKKGIQLREVSVGSDGDLFIMWTGYFPSKDEIDDIRVIGTKTGAIHFFGYYSDGIHPATGPKPGRLICFRIALPEKVGDRVTIRIPSASSIARFKNVRVKKLEPLKE